MFNLKFKCVKGSVSLIVCIIFTRLDVTRDEFWVGKWIYWTLTRVTIHKCACLDELTAPKITVTTASSKARVWRTVGVRSTIFGVAVEQMHCALPLQRTQHILRTVPYGLEKACVLCPVALSGERKYPYTNNKQFECCRYKRPWKAKL
jgi:hypothetical protein